MLDKADWLMRCAAQFVRRAGFEQSAADYLAQTCYDMMDDDDRSRETPEETADEELLNWTDDEGDGHAD